MASSLVAALDTHTPLQLGEKGHVEHGWSNDIQERIIQLSFQITRTTPQGVSELGETFYNIAFPLRNILEKEEAFSVPPFSLAAAAPSASTISV